jgi:NAD(P)-dependent dehydrogenase (short-subunit alcohol dehydrogenase family)
MEVADFGIAVTLIAPGDFRTGFTTARVVAAASRATDSACGSRAARAIAAMGRDVQEGADPTDLGELVVRIVEATRPRAIYTVGAAVQRAAPLLRRLLPTRAWDRITRAHYGG